MSLQTSLAARITGNIACGGVLTVAMITVITSLASPAMTKRKFHPAFSAVTI
jgi:hypothetical protein